MYGGLRFRELAVSPLASRLLPVTASLGRLRLGSGLVVVLP